MTSGKVIHINQDEIEMAEGFLEKVKNKEVTQGITCYRHCNGDIRYMLFNPDHLFNLYFRINGKD